MQDMEFEVGQQIKVPNGEHVGAVKSYEIRESKNIKGETIHYIDFAVSCDDVLGDDKKPVELKYGVPMPKKVTVANKLGRTFQALGLKVVVGGPKLKLSQLVGVRVRYMTKLKHDEKRDADFAEILDVLEKE